jgi:hypothetical protein
MVQIGFEMKVHDAKKFQAAIRKLQKHQCVKYWTDRLAYQAPEDPEELRRHAEAWLSAISSYYSNGHVYGPSGMRSGFLECLSRLSTTFSAGFANLNRFTLSRDKVFDGLKWIVQTNNYLGPRFQTGRLPLRRLIDSLQYGHPH